MDQKGSMAWPRDMALGPAPAMQGTGSDGLRLSSLAPSVVARSRRPQLAVSSPVPSVLSASVRVATVSTPAALADADGTGSTKAPYEQFTALQSPQMLQAQQQVEFQKSYLQHQQAQEAKTPKSGQRSGGLAGQHRLQAALSRPAASARGVLSTPRSVDPLEGVVNHVLSGEYPPDHPPPTPPAATDGAHSTAQPWASPLAAAAPPPPPQPPVAASPAQQRPQGLVIPHAAVSGTAGAKGTSTEASVLQTGTLLSQLQLQERQHQARLPQPQQSQQPLQQSRAAPRGQSASTALAAPAAASSPSSTTVVAQPQQQQQQQQQRIVPGTREALRYAALQKLQHDYERPELRTVSAAQGISPRYVRRDIRTLQRDVRAQALAAVDRSRSLSPSERARTLQ